MRFKKIIIGIISLFSICSCAYVEPDNSTKTLINCPDPSELISRPAEFRDVQVPAIDEKFENDYHWEVSSILEECTFTTVERNQNTNIDYLNYYIRYFTFMHIFPSTYAEFKIFKNGYVEVTYESKSEIGIGYFIMDAETAERLHDKASENVGDSLEAKKRAEEIAKEEGDIKHLIYFLNHEAFFNENFGHVDYYKPIDCEIGNIPIYYDSEFLNEIKNIPYVKTCGMHEPYTKLMTYRIETNDNTYWEFDLHDEYISSCVTSIVLYYSYYDSYGRLGTVNFEYSLDESDYKKIIELTEKVYEPYLETMAS